jgi:hypothetical protein
MTSERSSDHITLALREDSNKHVLDNSSWKLIPAEPLHGTTEPNLAEKLTPRVNTGPNNNGQELISTELLYGTTESKLIEKLPYWVNTGPNKTKRELKDVDRVVKHQSSFVWLVRRRRPSFAHITHLDENIHKLAQANDNLIRCYACELASFGISKGKKDRFL